MSEQYYLIVELNGAYYGLPAIAVQEIFLIPEVMPVAEAITDVLGVVNVRGTILPIINLPQLLGIPSRLLQPTDSIVLMQWQNTRVGIVVQQVCEVQEIAPEQIQTNYQHNLNASARKVISSIAVLESMLVTLIEPAGLVQSLGMEVLTREASIQTNDSSSNLLEHLSSEVRQLLQQRSLSLSQPFNSQDVSTLIPLAVVSLNNEYFGVGLELVHELVNVHKLSPIPCCPNHILGNMNLRGEILTLIDISNILNLLTDSSNSKKKAIVTQWHNSTIGIAVDDIFDVTYIDPAQIAPIPVAIHTLNHEYLQGVVRYKEKMMSILDLKKVIMADSLVVNEEF